ncbi:hypothetical protein [Brevundimonas sp.]|uniref:hypothetical protein n=1 Tax=Brevundimonas sp. TaxID=1871086 RepID=UPI002D46242A|nr:hypothetical protein [Brevundimonas sp.]HYC97442.1 hypothetical protein [Brevundimonas sp.]
MTQTPLQAGEAAGTMAASADLSELDPTARVVRERPPGQPSGRPRGLHVAGAWAAMALLPAAAFVMLRGRRRR